MASNTCDRIERPSTTPRGWHADAWRALRTTALALLDDEALVRRAQAGDYPAFDTLATRYRDRLYTMALGALGDEDEAGHALCETMVAAFRDLDSIAPECTPGAWLYLHALQVLFSRQDVPPGRYTLVAGPLRG